MNCIIYKITNIVNSKIYVGQTWGSLNVRFYKHYRDKNGCSKLRNAMQKYGQDKFSISFITVSHTQECADNLEIHFINHYDSIKSGYNIRNGGSRGKLSAETKRKISQANKGGTGRGRYTEEERHKRSIFMKTHPNNATWNKGNVPWNNGKITGITPWKGKTFSSTHRENLSLVHKGKIPNNKFNDETITAIKKHFKLHGYKKTAEHFHCSYPTVYKYANSR